MGLKRLMQCFNCGREIRTFHGGTVFVSLNDVDHYRRQLDEWRSTLNPQAGKFRLIDIANLLAMPERPTWQLWCDRCFGPKDNQIHIYAFGLDRIATESEAIGWLLHLMEKDWFQDTDIAPLMRRLFAL